MFKSSNDTPDTAKAKGSSTSWSDNGGLLIIVGFRGLSGVVVGKHKDELISYEYSNGTVARDKDAWPSLDSSLSCSKDEAGARRMTRKRDFWTSSQHFETIS